MSGRAKRRLYGAQRRRLSAIGTPSLARATTPFVDYPKRHRHIVPGRASHRTGAAHDDYLKMFETASIPSGFDVEIKRRYKGKSSVSSIRLNTYVVSNDAPAERQA